MIIQYTLHDNQKIYEDGFSRGATNELTVKEKDYAKKYKYTVYVTSGELDFELINASVVLEESLSYNDFIPLIRQSVWFESNAKYYDAEFLDEYFDAFAANYLDYFLNDIKDTVFISSSIFNWISGYRFMFLVYDVQFLPNENELVLERPIEHISFTNNYYGFEINNEPIQNWASFGKTTIKVATNPEFTYVTGDSFSLKKDKNANYSFSGNLSDKEVYTVFYRTKKPSSDFPVWLIVIQVFGGICAIYLMVEAVLLTRRKIAKRKGRNEA